MIERELLGEPLDILLIEDDPDHAEMIKRSLGQHNVANRICHLSDGEAALNYLFKRGYYKDRNGNAHPHVILLDLRLPKVDGLTVLKNIKEDEDLRKIPVVVITTSAADKDINAAYGNYVNSYLVKPVDFDKFSEMLENLGFYWLAWNHSPWE